MPFDSENDPGYIQRTLKAIQELEMPLKNKEKILSENAKKIIKINTSLR